MKQGTLTRLGVVFCLAIHAAGLAPGQVFSGLSPQGGKNVGDGDGPERGVRAYGAAFEVDVAALRRSLAKAPEERVGEALDRYGLTVELPVPRGAMVPCRVAVSPVMEPGLAAKFPEIATYLVQSEDGSASGRLEVTPRGLTAMLRTVEGRVWLIDAWRPGDTARIVSYWQHDVPAAKEAGFGSWRCETAEGVHGWSAAEPAGDGVAAGVSDRGPSAGLVTRKTFRLAVACTGEYGLHQCTVLGNSPNAADPLAAIVTVVSRANVVYEADLGVHFDLVANNDRIAYFDPATDPYPDTCDGTGGSDCSGGYLSVNIATLNSEIGGENYDIGHVLTRVYGGVAYLSSACGNSRAGGVSGLPRGGDTDPLVYLVMVHEIGHQFGAAHTFSGTRGRCQGNVTLSRAWEAGSGSSPMAYPGGCPVGDEPPSDNVAIFADPFFHHGSLGQMNSFLNGVSCPTATVTANHAPVIASSTAPIAIPPGTPFVLTAEATDEDGDPLLYSWEAYDSGTARPLTGMGSEDTGDGALFRIFPPVSVGERTFPRIEDVLSGVPTPGERLPTVTGVSRRFRVVVRDNHPGAGGTATSAFATLQIAALTTPFAVTEPTEGAMIGSGPRTVMWSVGGTDVPPVSCAAVEILLSSDDGQTFPQSLGVFPNTGSASVNLPGPLERARVRVSAVGGIFFAVSPRFEIVRCRGDFNGTGGVTIQDVFDFLAAYFGNDGAADVNASGTISVQDIFDFLAAYFGEC